MMTYAIRLSKYDPYVIYEPASTWTSVSDVGARFSGVVLERKEYERIEQLYLDAIAALLDDGKISTMYLQDVHATQMSSQEARSVREGAIVTVDDALSICRLALREEVSCRLESEEMYVHFGFDLYVYVGGAALNAATLVKIQESGLFVECDVPSPYLEA